MSEPTLQDLKELILTLDKKVETGLTRLEGEIKQVKTELTAEIKQVKTELVGEIKRVEEKVNSIDKRLGNEETISRTALGTLLLAALAGLIKYLFFTQV